MNDADIELFERADEIIAHFDIKGMHWGIRNHRTPTGAHPATDKMAKADAQEAARAKLYYGKGAGTRRKLINETVTARKKNDPSYAKAFDHHLAQQDLSVHATKAVAERNKTDRKDLNKQRRGAIARRLTGEMGTQAAFVAIAAGGAAYMASPKIQHMVKAEYKIAKNHAKRIIGARAVQKIINQMA